MNHFTVAQLLAGKSTPVLAEQPNPDARLIALCAAFDICTTQIETIYNTVPGDEDAAAEAGSVIAQRAALLNQITRASVVTSQGILAIARTLAMHAGDGGYSLDIDAKTVCGRLVGALLRNALILSELPLPGGLRIDGIEVPAQPVNPDAELLRLCAEFHRQHADATATGDDDYGALDDAMGIRWDISDQIEVLSPGTTAGMRAKAKVAVFLLEENRGPDVGNGSGDTSFACATLRDIAGRAAA